MTDELRPDPISVEEYVADYEVRGDADYKPTPLEQELIIDALHGYLATRPSPNAERVAELVCDGCGSNMTDADIKAAGALSCCPERKMLTAREFRDRASALEAERARLREALRPFAEHYDFKVSLYPSVASVPSYPITYTGPLEVYRRARTALTRPEGEG